MHTLANPRDGEALLRRLNAVHPDSPRRWGRMTAHEMVCHLADSFRMALGERPTRRRWNVVTRTLLKRVALDVPLPWPPGIPTSVEIDPRRGGARPGDFAADRAQAEALMRRVMATDATLGAAPHPLLGPLTRAEWLRWAYRHTEHHLRQFGV